MNRFIGTLVVILVSSFSFELQAAEPQDLGGVPAESLSSLGLAEMTPVSDEEGTKVRGMGNAVSGGSFAWGFLAPLSFSRNQYTASGTTFSQGGNQSYAGLGIPAVGGAVSPFPPLGIIGGFLTGNLALAGGSSYARNN
jgi:hypothetical protein